MSGYSKRWMDLPLIEGSDFHKFLSLPHDLVFRDITEEMSDGRYGFWMKVPVLFYRIIRTDKGLVADVLI